MLWLISSFHCGCLILFFVFVFVELSVIKMLLLARFFFHSPCLISTLSKAVFARPVIVACAIHIHSGVVCVTNETRLATEWIWFACTSISRTCTERCNINALVRCFIHCAATLSRMIVTSTFAWWDAFSLDWMCATFSVRLRYGKRKRARATFVVGCVMCCAGIQTPPKKTHKQINNSLPFGLWSVVSQLTAEKLPLKCYYPVRLAM